MAETAHTMPATLNKRERMVSRRLMDRLFGGGKSRSMSSFPLRVVYTTIERGSHDAPVQVLVSVSKRHFKRAVKRNRVKRQIREAYRNNKSIAYHALTPTPDRALALAFIWQADRLYDTAEVYAAMQALLTRLAEKLARHEANPAKTTMDHAETEENDG